MADEQEMIGEFPVTRTLQGVAEAITTDGYAMPYIFTPCGHGALAYTVGMTDKEHPELVVTGLPIETAAQVVRAVITRIRDEGPIAPRQELWEIIEAWPLREVVANPAPLFITKKFYPLTEFTAVQLLWPDNNGRFDGDEGYTLDRHIQPILEV